MLSKSKADTTSANGRYHETSDSKPEEHGDERNKKSAEKHIECNHNVPQEVNEEVLQSTNYI